MKNVLSIDMLIEENLSQLTKFNNCDLMKLLKSGLIRDQKVRDHILDYLQIFSNAFQKIVMQRFISTNTPLFSKIAEKHLQEEFGHNLILKKNRHDREAPEDYSIQENSNWFINQMLIADDVSKHVLMHLILETTADLFFKSAYKAFLPYEKIDYLHLHDEADEDHSQMGMKQLASIDLSSVDGLMPLFNEGWDRVIVICNRIAEKAIHAEVMYS